jgi:hypothetical protein
MESEMVLFDITVSAKHGEVTLYGLPLNAVGERAAAIAAQLECGFMPEQIGGEPPPGALSDFAIKHLDSVREELQKAAPAETSSGVVVSVPRDALYTEAHFNVCGARNALDKSERCPRIRGHVERHAYRKVVTDGAQPVPTSDLEASTG